MAIENKFTFIPAHQCIVKEKITRRLKHSVTINAHSRYALFSLSYIVDNDLAGKYIKFYLDKSKKAVAWKVFNRESSLGSLETYKLLKKDGTGCYTVSIGKALDSLKLSNKSYKKLHISEYTPADAVYEKPFDYVICK